MSTIKQNDIADLPNLDSFRYENIFNVYQNDSSEYYYNILTKVNFPDTLDENYYDIFVVPGAYMPYTLISYQVYGTILLWWLICSVNQIQNPIMFPVANTKLKILKPQLVRDVLQQIKLAQ